MAGVIILAGCSAGGICTVREQLYTEGEELNYVQTADLANGSFRTGQRKHEEVH